MQNMTHPDILQMERFGELPLYEPEPVKIGTCEHCGEDITDEYIYITDRDGNKFCCDDCFMEFYGYKEVRE